MYTQSRIGYIWNLYSVQYITYLLICVCVVPTCPRLTAPANGDVDCSLGDDGQPNPGDTCTFTCDDGFGLSGSASRTCMNDETWSGSTTSCSGASMFASKHLYDR